MDRKLVFTKKDSEEILEFPDKDLEVIIKEKYDFEIGYMPEGFNCILLLVEDNKEDSRKDKWIILFFKESIDYGAETVTLDNFDKVKKGKKTYEFFKEIRGVNFEDTINTSVDLIKKFYEDVKNENPL